MSVVAVDATVTGTIPTSSDTYSLVPSGLAKYISASRESFSYNLVSPNSFRENTSKGTFQKLTTSVRQCQWSNYTRESESSSKRECHGSVRRLLPGSSRSGEEEQQ